MKLIPYNTQATEIACDSNTLIHLCPVRSTKVIKYNIYVIHSLCRTIIKSYTFHINGIQNTFILLSQFGCILFFTDSINEVKAKFDNRQNFRLPFLTDLYIAWPQETIFDYITIDYFRHVVVSFLICACNEIMQNSFFIQNNLIENVELDGILNSLLLISRHLQYLQHVKQILILRVTVPPSNRYMHEQRSYY